VIHWDDLGDGEEAVTVWVELRMRVLAFKEHLGKPVEHMIDGAVGIDQLSMAQVGKPVKCGMCGWAAIDTDGYPWGQEKYKMAVMGVNGVYCPRCDGGEHQ